MFFILFVPLHYLLTSQETFFYHLLVRQIQLIKGKRVHQRPQQLIMNQVPNLSRPKRALSDQFNTDMGVIQQLEKELTYKYNKIIGITQTEVQLVQPSPEVDLLKQLSGELGISLYERRSSGDGLESLLTLKQHPPGINIKLNLGTPKVETPSKLPLLLDEQPTRHKGKLKFFNEAKRFGFLILDEDGTDVFLHQDDMDQAGITVESLRQRQLHQQNRGNPIINFANSLNSAPAFEFTLMNYIGKYNKSRKAVDVKLLQ